MTLRTNARLAGATFLLYIATGISALAIAAPVSRAGDTAALLAAIAAEPWRYRLVTLLSLAMFVYAIVLGVTLHALTRDDDADLAMFGLLFRSAEGIIGMAGTVATLALLWLATSAAAATLDPAGRSAVGSLLVRLDRLSPTASAFAFALGSLAFSIAFMRARRLPRWLVVTGVLASLLLVVALPLQLAGWFTGLPAQLVWLPMLVFELALAWVLLFRAHAYWP